MTTKRDSKRKTKSDKRPKVKKETLRDLEPKEGEKVKAGRGDSQRITCTCQCN